MLDFNLLLLSVIINPVLEKILSQGTDVAGTLSLVIDNSKTLGYRVFFSFHHFKGSDFLDNKGSFKYFSTSNVAAETGELSLKTLET